MVVDNLDDFNDNKTTLWTSSVGVIHIQSAVYRAKCSIEFYAFMSQHSFIPHVVTRVMFTKSYPLQSAPVITSVVLVNMSRFWTLRNS